MTIDDKIRDEKLQYDVNWEAAKISALSSGKNFNMNILQVKKILSDQRRVAEQAKFIYSDLGKALEKNKNGWISRRKLNQGTWKAWKATNYVLWWKWFFWTFKTRRCFWWACRWKEVCNK